MNKQGKSLKFTREKYLIVGKMKMDFFTSRHFEFVKFSSRPFYFLGFVIPLLGLTVCSKFDSCS